MKYCNFSLKYKKLAVLSFTKLRVNELNLDEIRTQLINHPSI